MNATINECNNFWELWLGNFCLDVFLKMPDASGMFFMVDSKLIKISSKFGDVVVILKLLHFLFIFLSSGILLLTGVILVVV